MNDDLNNNSKILDQGKTSFWGQIKDGFNSLPTPGKIFSVLCAIFLFPIGTGIVAFICWSKGDVIEGKAKTDAVDSGQSQHKKELDNVSRGSPSTAASPKTSSKDSIPPSGSKDHDNKPSSPPKSLTPSAPDLMRALNTDNPQGRLRPTSDKPANMSDADWFVLRPTSDKPANMSDAQAEQVIGSQHKSPAVV